MKTLKGAIESARGSLIIEGFTFTEEEEELLQKISNNELPLSAIDEYVRKMGRLINH